jgi:uridine kinase
MEAGGAAGPRSDGPSSRTTSHANRRGCETLDCSLSPFFDLRIWVDTDPETALARGITRDINEYGLDAAIVEADWRAWRVKEQTRLERDDRRRRADAILAQGQ